MNLNFCFKINELMEKYGFASPLDGDTWEEADIKVMPFLEFVEKELAENQFRKDADAAHDRDMEIIER